MVTVAIYSEQAMINLGEFLGERARPGDLFFLFGELGTGKTTLTKGIAKGLKIDEEITSPTFQLHKCYHGRYILNHLDLYRLGQRSELAVVDVEELFAEGITVVEWGRLLIDWLKPPAYLEVSITINPDFSSRTVTLNPQGPNYDDYLRSIPNADFGD